MADLTNKERLASIETSIKHIDSNIDKIAKNNTNQWKQINKNAQNISGIKAVGGIISLCIVGLFTFFGAKR